MSFIPFLLAFLAFLIFAFALFYAEDALWNEVLEVLNIFEEPSLLFIFPFSSSSVDDITIIVRNELVLFVPIKIESDFCDAVGNDGMGRYRSSDNLNNGY